MIEQVKPSLRKNKFDSGNYSLYRYMNKSVGLSGIIQFEITSRSQTYQQQNGPPIIKNAFDLYVKGVREDSKEAYE